MMKLHDWNKCRLMAHTTAHTLEKLAKDKYDITISVEYSVRELEDAAYEFNRGIVGGD